MSSYTFQKQVSTDILNDVIKATFSSYTHLNTNGTEVEVVFSSDLTSEEQAQLQNLISAHNPSVSQVEHVKRVIASAMDFGNSVIAQFAAENVIMGITQDGMTGAVRKNMTEVIAALSTGSLYDAIIEAKALTSDKKDTKYVTDTRLLQFINKIEVYLGLPPSSSL